MEDHPDFPLRRWLPRLTLLKELLSMRAAASPLPLITAGVVYATVTDLSSDASELPLLIAPAKNLPR